MVTKLLLFFTSLSQGSLREQERCSWGNAWLDPRFQVQDTEPQVQGTSGHQSARIREQGPRIRTKYQDPRNQEKLGSRNTENLENWERLKLQAEETNKYWWGKGNLSCAKFFLVHLDHTVDLLVYFDHTVDLPNKPEAGEEADCACKTNMKATFNWLCRSVVFKEGTGGTIRSTCVQQDF